MPNPAIDRLEQEISEDASVKNSAITLLNSLNTELKAVKEELAQTGVENDRLNGLIDSFDANTNALAEAVAANTAAAGE